MCNENHSLGKTTGVREGRLCGRKVAQSCYGLNCVLPSISLPDSYIEVPCLKCDCLETESKTQVRLNEIEWMVPKSVRGENVQTPGACVHRRPAMCRGREQTMATCKPWREASEEATQDESKSYVFMKIPRMFY